MNWDDLRYFLAVAEAQTLAGAATRLGVNHSTVFRRINRFEDEVGARLFERLADGYQLTAAGEDLLSHARAVDQEIDAVELKVLGKDYRPSGVVRVTAPDNLAYEYLPAYLAEFSARYPEIFLELDVSAASLDLTRRQADLAVRATSQPPPHLIGRRVVTLKWAFFASPAYLERNDRPRSQAALTTHRIIGADGALQQLTPFRTIEADTSLSICLRCSTLNAMSAMAEVGYAIALLPDDQAKPTLVRLFPFTPAFTSEIWLLTHPELRRTERIRLLMEHLHASFRKDPRLRSAR